MSNNLKEEGIKRMKKLGLANFFIEEFEKKDKVYVSNIDNVKDYYPIDEYLEYKKIKEDFEKESGHKVIHAIKSNTNFGTILDLIFISKYEDDWEYDFNKYNDKFYVMSMANNLTDRNLSDMGTIEVINIEGRLIRIG